MSWRLAAVFLLPIFFGLWIDSSTGKTIFVLVGLIIGIIGAVFVIKSMVRQYSVEVELDD